MAIRKIDLALSEKGERLAIAFENSATVTRHVRVVWDDGIKRSDLIALLVQAEEIIASRARAEGECAAA